MEHFSLKISDTFTYYNKFLLTPRDHFFRINYNSKIGLIFAGVWFANCTDFFFVKLPLFFFRNLFSFLSTTYNSDKKLWLYLRIFYKGMI